MKLATLILTAQARDGATTLDPAPAPIRFAMNNRPFSPSHARRASLHQAAADCRRLAWLTLSLMVTDPASFSNIVQRVRFWKFMYESDGLKVGGYMVTPLRR